MNDDFFISNIYDIKYRIKDHTGDEFDFVPKRMIRDSANHARLISEVAKEIGQSYYFYDDSGDLDNFKCCVDLLYRDKIYSFEITGEQSINWGYQLKEITDYTEIEGE